MTTTDDRNSAVIAETRAWVDRAVIGLNLCPFAKAPQVKGQVRYVVSDAAELPARGVACFVGRHTRGTVGLLLQCEMRLHLGGHVAFDRCAAEKRAQEGINGTNVTHGTEGTTP